jgi:23S rRNA (adenine2503-C2)-methyltransferase
MSTDKTSLVGLDLDGLSSIVQGLGLPSYRARQIHRWIYDRMVLHFAEMTDLPRGVREALAAGYVVAPVTLAAVRSDERSGTHKALVGLEDGGFVEGVVLLNRDRVPTLCVSSQVGCPVGCLFCATGRMGFTRNMTSSEMLGQILVLIRFLRDRTGFAGHPNVVFMGMGEPLLNRRHLLETLGALTDPARLGLGKRHVTVSTIGVPEGIRALASHGPAIHLALSLHHPDERRRRELMPHAKASLDDVLDALREHADRTKRMTTFEYVLLGGVNDGRAEAEGVVRRVRQLGRHVLVNLIPYNPVEGAPFERSAPTAERAFAARLSAAGVRTTVRRTQGDLIDAACGQLAFKGFEGLGARPFTKTATRTEAYL